MYPFKVVEAALARLHVENPATMGIFRGRIKHLQRIGLVPSSPGPGKRIQYSFEDVSKWALALEVAEFGIDPTIIQQIVLSAWSRGVFGKIDKGDHGQNDLLIIKPNAVSHPHSWQTAAPGEHEARSFNPKWSQNKRTMVINVSLMGRELKQALADAESGSLDDYMEKAEEAMQSVRASEADLAHIKAALKNRTPGAAIGIGRVGNGPLVTEIGPDGPARAASEATPPQSEGQHLTPSQPRHLGPQPLRIPGRWFDGREAEMATPNHSLSFSLSQRRADPPQLERPWRQVGPRLAAAVAFGTILASVLAG